ncbi:MAG: dihydrodipicolinate synthase family protein [Phycisphaerales bacterium]
MTTTHIISAIGTPLTEDDSLHIEGLQEQLALQWRNGITGILAGGSMGAMQLLSDQTYADLVRLSIKLGRGKGEIMVGVGDTSFARTRDRIHLVNRYKPDAVAVLTPYMWKYSQSELVDYYHAIADESLAPVYLYDLPQLTGLKVEASTVLAICGHKNIHGIKCSDAAHDTRMLIETLKARGSNFRVIVAQPVLLDMLVRHGVRDHLDGIFALAPEWASAIVRHAEAGEYDAAAAYQRDLLELLTLLRSYNAFAAFSAMMNARGIPGRFAPRPFHLLSREQTDMINSSAIMKKLLAGSAYVSPV